MHTVALYVWFGFLMVFTPAAALPVQDTDKLLSNALEAFREGDQGRALDMYEAVLETRPGNKKALQMAGLIRYRAMDYGCAEKCFRRAFDRHGDVYSLVMLGNVLLQTFRPLEAEDCYSSALELDPNNDLAEENLQQARIKVERAEQAARLYRRTGFVFWGGIGIGLAALLYIIYLEIKSGF